MKKILGIIFLVGMTGFLISNDYLKMNDDSVRAITFTVTLCKQDDTDPVVWENIVRNAQEINNLTMSKRIKKISKWLHTARHAESNLLSDVQAQFSDGVCRCINRQACQCYEKYRGVCPCATLTTKSCDDSKVRCCSKN